MPEKGDSQHAVERPIVEYHSLVLTGFFRLSVVIEFEKKNRRQKLIILNWNPAKNLYDMIVVCLKDDQI